MPPLPALVLGFLFTASITSADPHSPFTRYRTHQHNYHLNGVSSDPQQALLNHPSLEQQGKSNNPFDVVYQWRVMDFEYPSAEAKRRALANG